MVQKRLHRSSELRTAGEPGLASSRRTASRNRTDAEWSSASSTTFAGSAIAASATYDRGTIGSFGLSKRANAAINGSNGSCGLLAARRFGSGIWDAHSQSVASAFINPIDGAERGP